MEQKQFLKKKMDNLTHTKSDGSLTTVSFQCVCMSVCCTIQLYIRQLVNLKRVINSHTIHGLKISVCSKNNNFREKSCFFVLFYGDCKIFRCGCTKLEENNQIKGFNLINWTLFFVRHLIRFAVFILTTIRQVFNMYRSRVCV